MASNPYDAISTVEPRQSSPRSQRGLTYIEGPPREPAPQTQAQAAGDAASAAAAAANANRTNTLTPYDAARARAEAEAQAATNARGGLTAEQAGEREQRLARLRSASQRLLSVGQRYTSRYRDSDYPVSLPGALSSENQAFDADASALVADVFAIARVPGVGSQSDREQAAFNEAYLPASGYYDSTNEQRLDSIQTLLNEQRAAAGLPPINWRGNEGGTGLGTRLMENAARASGAVAGAQQPPPPDPNQVQPGEGFGRVGNLPGATDVERQAGEGRNVLGTSQDTEATPEDIAKARRIASTLTAMSRQGVSIERMNAYLRQQGVEPIEPAEVARIQEYRRRGRGRDYPGFTPRIIPTGRPTEEEQQRDESFGVQDSRGAGTAAVTGYLDAASLGLPGLVSEDYRNRVSDVQENSPVAYTLGAIPGALIAPGGPRPGMSLLQQSGRSAGQGFVYGLNSSGGDVGNALVGGGIGAAVPGVLNTAGRAARAGYRGTRNFLARPGNYGDAEAQALARALDEEGVPGSRPLLDPASRDRMAYLESSLGTGEAVRAPLQATREAIEARAARLGEGGTAEELGTMGQRVQEAGQRYIDRSRNVGRRMYDRAAQLAGDTPVQGREAVQEIDAQLAALRRNPNSNSGEVNFLEGLRRDFVDENGNLIPKTVADIRDLRTGLRGRVNQNNLTFSQVEARVLGILGRAADDIERDLGGAAAPANRAYRRADRFYAERQSEIRQVVSRVIGRSNDNLSGEQVMQRIRTMASNRGDSERLSRLWARLTPAEQLDAAATIAETAGRRGADEAFSPAQFLNWSRQLSPAARRTIFGPEGARSINNLARISEALQATERRLNNSRSGVVANWNATLRDFLKGGPIGMGVGLVGGGSALTSGAAGAALGAATSLAGIAGRRLSARSLMSPDLSRWLAAAPRATTPSAIRRHIDRLQLVARANPAISQEVTGLRQALMQAVNDNAPQAGRLAASPSEGPDDANQ